MADSLYGDGAPGGFFVREAPRAHFRTSVHVSPLFGTAVARLLRRVDEALDRPGELTLLDIGAGRGELLEQVRETVAEDDGYGLAERLRPVAVERASWPGELDPRTGWTAELPPPGSVTGLVFANEWLDNVPLDVAETDEAGVQRYVLVDEEGRESRGEPVTGPDAEWLRRWWPLHAPPGSQADSGLRAEIGLPRDAAWAAAVRTLHRGVAVAVDYAHTRTGRPPLGTLTGYLEGREVPPAPDGASDLTAHVAVDAC
ncbi:hypothetical protein N566_04350, partial [Streptomycetaceae bacterium MP113-05]